MTRREVVLLMGTPAKIHTEGTHEVLQFNLHKSLDDPYAPDQPYWVFLEDGKVVRHGRDQDFKSTQPQQNEDITANIQFG